VRKRHITVTVSGPPRSGKSTVAVTIAAYLNAVPGCRVKLEDSDSTAALATKYEHARQILRNSSVTIKTKNWEPMPGER